ncbi:hypothetical protein R5R35_003170 [Gryllus longicercus]|uniref:Uncharacterized protein n=1 Tax=Gryllus longicercus TaxID=2509291 RepID=A0AAN9VJZ0_9ORTH
MKRNLKITIRCSSSNKFVILLVRHFKNILYVGHQAARSTIIQSSTRQTGQILLAEGARGGEDASEWKERNESVGGGMKSRPTDGWWRKHEEYEGYGEGVGRQVWFGRKASVVWSAIAGHTGRCGGGEDAIDNNRWLIKRLMFINKYMGISQYRKTL